MKNGVTAMALGTLLATAFAVSACGGDDGSEPGASGGTSNAGGSSAGSAGSSAAGSSSSGGAGTGAGGTGSGGAASGGSSSAGSGGASTGGSAGSGGSGTSGSGGSGGDPNEPCIPASTDGIAYSGTCTYADHCTDEYDITFGVAALQALCEGQEGTWSTTTTCNAADWGMKCTQEVLGGIYIQYQGAGDICALGCEEAL